MNALDLCTTLLLSNLLALLSFRELGHFSLQVWLLFFTKKQAKVVVILFVFLLEIELFFVSRSV